jgi:FlaA1/EpsC-like NDP-sugar epimerase
MGDPVRIADLAKNMIRLSGYEPEKEIKIKYIGLRPGEKLYEELLMNEEGMQTTENSRIFIGRQIAFDEKVFREQIKELAKEAENECPNICYLVKKMVPEYQYEGEKQE